VGRRQLRGRVGTHLVGAVIILTVADFKAHNAVESQQVNRRSHLQ